MKKKLLVIMAIGLGMALLGGPPPDRKPRSDHRRRDHRPPPPPHHHHHHGGSDGVRLAADIVGLVGASVNLLAPRPAAVVVPAQPAVVVPAEPVMVQQPVQQPVVQQPVVQQPVQQPVNNHTTIIIQQQPTEPAKVRNDSGYNPHGYNL